MKLIDLHVHTTASDGRYSPEEIVGMAIKKKIKAISITDHDTIAGIDKAIEYAKNKPLKIIPGIEIGVDQIDKNFYDIHLIGLFINHKNKEIIKITEKLKKARIKQKKEIIRKLNSLGYEISFEELCKEVGDSFGRPHIARILARKYCLSQENIFDNLIGSKGKAFVLQEKPNISEAISVIKRAGGKAILAHPGLYLNDAEQIINLFIKYGGDGIEVDYPYSKITNVNEEISKKLIQKFKRISIEKNLLISGGSDFHGKEVRPVDLGEGGITSKELIKLMLR